MDYFDRGLEWWLEKTFKTRPLVYLNGPRQTGKSTLTRNLHIKGEANYISFDSPVILAAANADPAKFMQSLPAGKLNIIDEVQMAPEIFPYLKISVDESRTRGKGAGLYLLTGSANLMALPRLAEALVGRMSVVTLLPFSSSEYKQTGINFIENLFKDKLEYRRYKDYDLLDIIANSTFPEPALNPKIDRTQWFDDYLTTILQRDIRTVADIRNPIKTFNLLTVLTMRAGSLLNNSLAAAEIGLDIKTYERYKAAVVNTFIIFELPSWAKPNRLNKRIAKSPKLFFTDTNLLIYLMRRDLREMYKNDRTTMGHVFENFIATEIMKNAAPLADIEVSHFRTADQKEVDFVIEKSNGELIGVEVKLEGVPNNHDFAGLKLLREAVGTKFKKGVVVYSGTELVSFGDGLWAVPVCYFWEGLQ
ncbi:ATPase [Spirochaetia bacterium]|nr:ATPase [Spirochaetia bacterium]